MISAKTAATTKKEPTYSKPAANKSEFHEFTPLINSAADIYLAEIKTADIKQKIAPTILLSIFSAPTNPDLSSNGHLI